MFWRGRFRSHSCRPWRRSRRRLKSRRVETLVGVVHVVLCTTVLGSAEALFFQEEEEDLARPQAETVSSRPHEFVVRHAYVLDCVVKRTRHKERERNIDRERKHEERDTHDLHDRLAQNCDFLRSITSLTVMPARGHEVDRHRQSLDVVGSGGSGAELGGRP